MSELIDSFIKSNFEFDEKNQYETWENELAVDLNIIVGRLIYIMETDGDECDCQFVEACIRLLLRSQEFENLKLKNG